MTTNENKTRRILLVGGAGYVGSVVTAHLLGCGHAVRCLDMFLYGNHHCVVPFLGTKNYEFQYGNLCDPSIREAALSGVTDVVLLAGLVGDPITKKYPEASHSINDEGVAALVDDCAGRGLERLIFVSTCSNYGLIPGDALADEDFELAPLSAYAKSKVAIERKILSLRGAVDYQPTILRFATAFGVSPRMRFDLTVSEFTREMYLNRELVVYDADTWRPYCHVRDFAAAIHDVLEAASERVAFEVFNVGGDKNNFTKRMIVDAVKKFLPQAPVAYREHGSDPRNYRVNFAKIKSCLGFEPHYSVADGIAELLKALSLKVFDNVDRDKNFYGNYELPTDVQ